MIIKKHNLFVWNSTCWHQITRYGIWHLSSMAKVVPNCCIFYILLCGHIFENVPFYLGMQITSFTSQEFMNKCMWYICTFNGDLVCASMLFTLLPHQVHIWKWWLCKVFDLYTLRLGSSSHDYDYPKCALQEKNPCQNP